MAEIDHPDDDGSIDVEIIDRESHYSEEMVQVEASDDSISLSDESGDKPWLFAEEVGDA